MKASSPLPVSWSCFSSAEGLGVVGAAAGEDFEQHAGRARRYRCESTPASARAARAPCTRRSAMSSLSPPAVGGEPKSVMRTSPSPSIMTLAGFEVAMQAPLSRVRPPLRAQLPRELDRFVLGNTGRCAGAATHRIFAVDVLHREEAPAVPVAGSEAADVLVRHLPRDAQLVVKLREPGCRRRRRRRAGTQRDRG